MHPSDPTCRSAAHPVRLTLLGKPALWVAGRPVVPLKAKDPLLLALLAIDGPQPRAGLNRLLWPESESGDPGANLRQRAMRLRNSIGQDVFDSGATVQLMPTVSSDWAELDQFSPQQLLDCGELLAGVDDDSEDAASAWLRQARHTLRQRRADALATHAEALRREGRLAEALPLAQCIVNLLPLAEHAARRLMQLHYLRHDRGAALAEFERLSRLMLDLHDTQPSAETLQLWQTIETSGRSAPLTFHDAGQRPGSWNTSTLMQQPVPASVMLPPVLVGRGEAWHAMADAWQQQRPFVLVAEAGMGKTRLLADFARGRAGVVADKARPGDEQSPYAVLGRLLLQVQQQFAPEADATTRRELARIHTDFGTPWPVKAQVDLLWSAVETFLASALARGLQALLVDDLQTSDPASLEALRWLAQSPRLAGLRLALATRPLRPGPGGQAPWLDLWLADSQAPVRVALAPLSPADLSALLASLALPALVDPAVTQHLYRHAGGHPLYTLATLQDALTHGHDLRRAKLPAPPSVQALLDARLRELPSTALPLLHVAAVAGADLSVERAAALLGCGALDLSGPWGALEAANVLRGETFVHDLVHEAALRSVPLGLRQALHRQLGALLATDPAAPAARIAWHWESGERWAEAGRCWFAAGQAARQTGRLAEQAQLFENAARCQAQAGDPGARFEALFARLDGLLLRSGAAAVLAALPEVQALADTSERHLRCHLVRGEALMDSGHTTLGLAEADSAVQRAVQHPPLQAEASALHALGLARAGREGEALAAARLAVNQAEDTGNLVQRLRAGHALAYVHYAAGRLGEAVPAQRQFMRLADEAGDRSEAASAEGNLAALLSAIGDTPAAHAHALHAQQRHQAIGLAQHSSIGAVNFMVLGASAAYLGHLDQALDALQAGVVAAGQVSAAWTQAKARLALGNLYLTLGRADLARTQADALPGDMPPGMRMQAALLLARAGALDGLPQQRHWQNLAQLGEQHPQLVLVQSAWFELSFLQGDPRPMIDRLTQVQHECQTLGLSGTARALQWRLLSRWLDLDGDSATTTALRHAQALLPHVARGLSAKVYPPSAWLTLARAFQRAGQAAEQADCLAQARRWLAKALPQVPGAYLGSFANTPDNRLLLAGVGG